MLKIYTAIRINHETIGLSTKRTQSAPSKHFAHYKFEKKNLLSQTQQQIKYVRMDVKTGLKLHIAPQ